VRAGLTEPFTEPQRGRQRPVTVRNPTEIGRSPRSHNRFTARYRPPGSNPTTRQQHTHYCGTRPTGSDTPPSSTRPPHVPPPRG